MTKNEKAGPGPTTVAKVSQQDPPGLTTSTPKTSSPLPSSPTLLLNSYRFFIQNWNAILPVIALPVVFELASIFFGQSIPTFVFSIINFLIRLFSPFALLYVIARNTKSGLLESYKQVFKLIGPIAKISILSSLAIFGGYLLLIVPGIMLSLWLSLALYVFFGENLKGTQALTRSWQLVRGNSLSVFWRFLFLWLVILLFSLISIFPLITNGNWANNALQASPPDLGTTIYNSIFTLLFGLVVTPISSIYTYLLYTALKERKPQANEEIQKKRQKKIVIFAWLGVVFFILTIALLIFIFMLIMGIYSTTSSFTPSFSQSPFPSPFLNEAVPTLPPTENLPI